ncbi:MAG: hypothetical protein ACLQNE_02880 [Thermoguttaceae bacterium]
MNDLGQTRSAAFRRAVLSLGGFLLLLAVAMFLPAGIGWVEGWVFLLVFLYASRVCFRLIPGVW